MLRLTFSLLFCCMVLLCGCGPTDNDVDLKCGPAETWFALLDPKYSNVENGIRTIQLRPTKSEPDDICSEAGHVKPAYVVFARAPDNALPADIKLTAVAQIPLLQPRTAVMVNDGNGRYTASVEIGLTQSYKGKPGFIVMQIHAEFPSRGDYATDSTYLMRRMLSADAELDYRKYVAGL